MAKIQAIILLSVLFGLSSCISTVNGQRGWYEADITTGVGGEFGLAVMRCPSGLEVTSCGCYYEPTNGERNFNKITPTINTCAAGLKGPMSKPQGTSQCIGTIWIQENDPQEYLFGVTGYCDFPGRPG